MDNSGDRAAGYSRIRCYAAHHEVYPSNPDTSLLCDTRQLISRHEKLTENETTIQVLVYPVRNAGSDWEYLLLRRVPVPSLGLGGFWQGVTGGVEEGEDLVEAAMRELAEETGFVPSALEQIDYSYSFPMQDEWREIYGVGVEKITEYVFVAFVDGQQEPTISREHDRWQWCSLNQAMELLTYPGNIEALKRSDSFLKARPGAN